MQVKKTNSYVKQFHFCVKWREGREGGEWLKKRQKGRTWVHEANHKSISNCGDVLDQGQRPGF